MGIFGRGERPGAPPKYKILLVAEDGEVLFWHKGGQLHVVDEDVARAFVGNFRPDLFEVASDGSLLPPAEGRETKRILRVEMKPV